MIRTLKLLAAIAAAVGLAQAQPVTNNYESVKIQLTLPSGSTITTSSGNNVVSGSNWVFPSGSIGWASLSSVPASVGTFGSLANAAGWLHNDGSGTLAYSTPTYSQVGADPAGAAAAITLSGLGGVPTSRTVNGYALTGNISLTYTDVGADASGAAAARQAAYTILTTLGTLSNATGWLYNNGSGTLSYSTPPGGGNVTGPGSSTSGHVALFNNNTGTLLQDGGALGTASTYAASAFEAANTNLGSIAALSNSAGWLYNTGSGSFTYSTPTYSQVGADAAGAAAAITLSGLGGVPTSRTVNGHALSSNISLTYSDVGADAAGAAAAVTTSSIGAVPTSTTVNGHALTGNISLTYGDVGADASGAAAARQAAYTNLSTFGTLSNSAGWLYNNGAGTLSYSTPTYSQVGADAAGAAAAITLSGLGGVPTSRTVNGHALSSNISLTYTDVGADQYGAAATRQAAYTNLTAIGSLANANGYLLNNGSGGFSYVPASGVGTVTSITAGTGLTGSSNPITSSGTLSVTQYTFNIANYGASPSNSASANVTAINSAISAMNTAGRGVLLIPDGTFNINSTPTTITVPCTIQGHGRGVSTINQTSGSGTGFVINTGNSCLVTDLTITGPGGSRGSGSSGYGISFSGSGTTNDQSTIRDCTFTGFNRGVDATDTSNLHLRDVYMTGCNAGLYYNNTHAPDAGGGFVTGCLFLSNYYGIYQLNNGGETITGCQFHDNLFHIDFQLTNASSGNSDIKITGNWMDQWQYAAIDLGQGDSSNPLTNITITGNSFSALAGLSAGDVIVCTATSSNWLQNFTICGNSFQYGETASGSAINLQNATQGTISGNQFFQVGGYTGHAINLASSCSLVTWDPNQLFDNPNGAPVVDNQAFLSVSSGSTITLPNYGTYCKVTGTTTVSTIANGWQGRTIDLLIPSGVTFTTGGNIAAAVTAPAGTLVKASFDGSSWYLAN